MTSCSASDVQLTVQGSSSGNLRYVCTADSVLLSLKAVMLPGWLRLSFPRAQGLSLQSFSAHETKHWGFLKRFCGCSWEQLAVVAWLRQSEGIDLGAAAVAGTSSLWQSSAQGSRQMKPDWQGWLVPPVICCRSVWRG